MVTSCPGCIVHWALTTDMVFNGVLMVRVLVARVAQQSLGGVYGAPNHHGGRLGLVVQPRSTVHLKVNEINITVTVNDSAWRG